MALKDIYEDLDSCLSGDSFSYSIGTKSDLAELDKVLGRFLITGNFTLKPAQLFNQNTQLLLKGQTTWGPLDKAGQCPAQVTLTITLSGDTPRFLLSMSLSAPSGGDWDFKTSFPRLEDNYLPEAGGLGLTMQPSVILDMQVKTPVLTGDSEVTKNQLAFSGQLLPTVNDIDFSDWFGSDLACEGDISLPDDLTASPDFSISTTSSRSIALGPLNLQNLGIQLYVSNKDDPDKDQSPFSQVSLVADFNIGSSSGGAQPIQVTAWAPLVMSGRSWRLQLQFRDQSATLAGGLAQIAEFFGIDAALLTTPPTLGGFESFYVSEVEVWLQRKSDSGLPTQLSGLVVSIQSTKEWNPPIPFVTLNQVGTRWVAAFNPDGSTPFKPMLAGSVFGTLNFGDQQKWQMNVNASFPDYTIAGHLNPLTPIPIGEALNYYFENAATPVAGMQITSLNLLASPTEHTYIASAKLDQVWSLDLGNGLSFDLQQMELSVEKSQFSLQGTIAGIVQISVTEGVTPLIHLTTEVHRLSTGSQPQTAWSFNGMLDPSTPVSLTKLLGALLPQVASGLPDLSIDQLRFSYATGSKTYSAAGSISGRWTPSLFGNELKINSSAWATVNNQGVPAPQGRLGGNFAVNRINLIMERDVGVDKPTYLFRVEIGQLWFNAVTSWRQDSSDPARMVISLKLGGKTLGEILEYFANLAAPTVGFKLESPWDLLNKIDLSAFTLVLDPDKQVVEFTLDVDVDLSIMSISKIGVRYQKQQGRPAVNLILDGDFLGKDYSGDNALSWDVLSESPPSIAEKSDFLVDLRYLGIGQHVKLTNTQNLNSVKAVIDQLKSDLKPVKPGEALLTNNAIEYSATREWLIGLDINLMNTLDLGLVFNDPALYGLRIALSGERAGSLSGLEFEILYKKITDNIGMYRIELQIPEAFRRIQLGAVTVTLGIIVVEIYTNGNFKVDLGFPYQRSFQRSFSVEVFPFLGRGGIYFGYLNGATSSNVPSITNGSFSPVLELGIGLAVGVGKTVSIGPLSGGAYVELEVIFQGVLAWYNPSQASQAPAKYFRVQGLVALHGKLWGAVDFGIIKASISLEAYASAAVLMQVFEPTLIELSIRVSARASVSFLFFTIHFSFDVSWDASFTLGHKEATPWIVGNAPNSQRVQGPYANHYLVQRRRRSLYAKSHYQLLMRQRLGLAPQQMLGAAPWSPDQPVFPGGVKKTCNLNLVPAYSIKNPTLGWGTTPAGNTDPNYQASWLLMAENGIPANSIGTEEVKLRNSLHSPSAGNTTELAADMLMEGFLRWALAQASIQIQGQTGQVDGITLGGLLHLLEETAGAECAQRAFSFANLQKFLQTNFTLRLVAPPAGSANDQGGFLVAMPPLLTLARQGGESNDLSKYNLAGAAYEQTLNSYMGKLFPAGFVKGDTTAGSGEESVATFVFRDWCLLLTRQLLQHANKSMETWSFKATDNSSIQQLLDQFPNYTQTHLVQQGDSLANLAQNLGLTASELGFLNPDLAEELTTSAPGSSVEIKLGPTPEAFALDNKDQAFSKTVSSVQVTGISLQVQQNDDLDAIAHRIGDSNAAPLLADQNILNKSGLLQAGAVLQRLQEGAPTTATFTNSQNWSKELVAGYFFARYALPVLPDTDWYLQSILAWNGTQTKPLQSSQLLAADLELKAPSALFSEVPAEVNFKTLGGESVLLIAIALNLSQNYASSPSDQPPGWSDFYAGVTSSDSGASYQIPQINMTVQPGETLFRLAARSYFAFDGATLKVNPAGIKILASQAKILSPLALITPPAVTLDLRNYNSFTELSAQYGISIPELGRLLVATSDLIPQDAALIYRHLPVLEVEKLVNSIIGQGVVAEISGLVSRQLLSGPQLPDPAGKMQALYDIIGQQLKLTAADGSMPDSVTLEATPNAGTELFQCFDSALATEDETVGEFVTRYPDAKSLNPRLANMPISDPMPQGIAFLTAQTENVSCLVEKTSLQALFPNGGLQVTPLNEGPKVLPLAEFLPVSHGLDHHVQLQTPIYLPIPGTTDNGNQAGNPSLWPFGQDLLNLAIHAQGSSSYQVFTQEGINRSPFKQQSFTSRFTIQVQQTQAQGPLYELLGASSEDRAIMLALLAELPAEFTNWNFYLAVAPSPTGGNQSGLRVLDLNKDACFLFQSNLSTARVPGKEQLTMVDTETPTAEHSFLADFNQPLQLLQLLWEGAVVGGSGYFLGILTSQGEALPNDIFNDQGSADLEFIFLPPMDDSDKLMPARNCLLSAAQLDHSIQTLLVQKVGETAQTPIALAPTGSAGVNLQLDPEAAQSQSQLNGLFSMLAYQLGADAKGQNGSFTQTMQGLPATPAASDGSGTNQRLREALADAAMLEGKTPDNPPATKWDYSLLVPVSNFGPPSLALDAAGLPDVAGDPYRGIGGQSSMQNANFKLAMGDGLGNRTNTNDNKDLAVPVGYTDDLIGIQNWPGMSAVYDFTGSATAPVLSLSFGIQAGSLTPGLTEPGSNVLHQAQERAVEYDKIFFQQWQSLPSPTLNCSLYPTDFSINGLQSGLTRFATAARLFVGSIAQMQEAEYIVAKGGVTLASLLGGYAYLPEHWGLTNQAQSAEQVLGGQPFLVPAYLNFKEGDSPTSFVQGIPSNWKLPTLDADQLLNLTQNKEQLPLSIGILLNRTPVALTLSAPQSFAEVAETQQTQVGPLAASNAEKAILGEGLTFEVQGVTQVVSSSIGNNKLSAIVDAYAGLNIQVTAEELAVSVEDDPSALDNNAVLSIEHLVVPEPPAGHPPYTLESLSKLTVTGQPIGNLVSLNLACVNIFPPGSALHLGHFPNPATLSAGSTPTLGEFAGQYALTPGLLLHGLAQPGSQTVTTSNQQDFKLPAGAQLLVPGSLQLPEQPEDKLFSLWQIDNDSLDTLSGKFGTSGEATNTKQALLGYNFDAKGLLAAGVSVTLNGITQTTVAGNSPAQFLAQFDPDTSHVTKEQLIAALAGLDKTRADKLLNPSALMVVPRGYYQQTASPTAAVSLKQIADCFGRDAISLANANAALPDLVQPGVALNYTDDNSSFSVTSGNHDNLNALVARFAAKGCKLSLPQLLTQNLETGLFQPEARYLLPPATLSFTHNFTDQPPRKTNPLVNLSVTMKQTRPSALVPEEFLQGKKKALETTCNIAAPAQPGGGANKTLLDFSSRLRQIFPQMRLATGNSNGSSDLWLVDFSGQGDCSIQMTAPLTLNGKKAPRTFALRPLYASLLSRSKLQVKEVKPDGTIANVMQKISFQGVDAEIWANNLLKDLDLFVSAKYAHSLQRLAGDALTQAMQAKVDLLAAIPTGLELVLEDSAATDKAASLKDAKEALTNLLGESLSKGYSTDAVVQYDSNAVNFWAGSTNQESYLYGSPMLPESLTNDAKGATLGNGKISLQSSGFVSVPFHLADVQLHKAIALPIGFQITDLEYKVNPVPGVVGYKSSEWLTFLPPLNSESLPDDITIDTGEGEVPLPMRYYPAMPKLVYQSSAPQSSDAPQLQDTAVWQFINSYSHQFAEQDQVLITLEYNNPDQDLFTAKAGGPDLAAALAQYNEAAPLLRQLLTYFSDGKGNKEYAIAAANSFVKLASLVAQAWAAHWGVQPPYSGLTTQNVQPTAPQPMEFKFSSDVEYQQDKMTSFVLEYLPESTGTWPDADWPEATFILPNGSTIPLGYGTQGTGGPNTRVYDFPSTEKPVAWPCFQLVWPRLNMAQYQNAKSHLQVQRNSQLLTGAKTNPDFVFSTDIVTAANAVYPFNQFKEAIPINSLGDNLAAALDAAFAKLFTVKMGGTPTNLAPGQPVSLAISYGNSLSQQNPQLNSALPFALFPDQTIVAPGGTERSTGEQIAANVASWQAANLQPEQGGEWVFQFTLYSQLGNKKPLLELGHLSYQINKS